MKIISLEYDKRDKKVHKMTRDGLAEQNLATGEETRISDRERDFNLQKAQEPVSVRQAISESRSRHSPRHTKEMPQNTDNPPVSMADPLPQAEQEAPLPEQDDRRRYDDTHGEFSETARRRRGAAYQRQSAAGAAKNAADGQSPEPKKLRFSEKETPPADAPKKVKKTYEKAERSAAKAESARRKLPKKHSIRMEKRLDEKSGKPKRQLRFDEEVKTRREHLKGSLPSRPVKAGANAAIGYAHKKIGQTEQENVGVEAAHKGGLAAEGLARSAYRMHKTRPYRRAAKLEQKSARDGAKYAWRKTLAENPRLRSNPLSRIAQKQKIKKEYAKAAREAKRAAERTKKAGTATAKATKAVAGFVSRHPVAVGVTALLLVAVIFCSSMFTIFSNLSFGGLSSVLFSSYVADDTDIDQAELYYTELETDLQLLINRTESDNPGYDVYQYNISEISHNPYELAAFLTAVYGDFSFDEVRPVLDGLFAAQYGLSAESYRETRTQTKTVEVGGAIGEVRTTAYCACSICCGPYANGITASGTTAAANRTIAVDAYNPIVPMGTKVVIGGVMYTVEDTGNLAANGVDFDIYFSSHAEALVWGRKTLPAYLGEGNENTVEVTITEEVRVLETSLASASFTSLIYAIMDSEQREHFSLLMETKGNRQYLESPFDFNWLSYVTSSYGYRVHPASGVKNYHKGVDIGVPAGTGIHAGQDGTVTFAGYSGDYGYVVVIEDGNAGSPGGSLVSKYAHCSTLLVSAGQTVQAGDVIARVGNTGNSTGPHLHLEIIKDGQYLNPLYFAVTNDDSAGPAYSTNPGAAMGDGSFAAMLAEAEKYLVYPYVWGGSSPSTSFDCSGYVSWVINQSGVGNVGRQTAQGLYNLCTPVSAGNAKPGDLIFFVGTYSTTGVSHVGIYVGNGQMIHCGNPIQYTSINTSYWQSHFYSFGRIN